MHLHSTVYLQPFPTLLDSDVFHSSIVVYYFQRYLEFFMYIWGGGGSASYVGVWYRLK